MANFYTMNINTKKRLDFGTNTFNYIPGPGTYNVPRTSLSDFSPIKIGIKYPIPHEDPTKDVPFYCPPIEAPVHQRKKKKAPEPVKKVEEEVDPDALRLQEEKELRIAKKKREKEEQMQKFIEKIEKNKQIENEKKKHRMAVFDKKIKPKKEILPGPGQYDPVEKETRIRTSLNRYCSRESIWEGDNGVPGPGKYTITKSYGKPSNWTKCLRFKKPVHPVHYLERQMSNCPKKKTFKPIIL